MSKKVYDVFRDGEFLGRVEVNHSTPAEARKGLIAAGYDTNVTVRPAYGLTPDVSKNFTSLGVKLKAWEKKRPPVQLTTGH